MNHEYSLLINAVGDQTTIDNLYLFNLYYYFYQRGYSNLILKDLSNVFVLIFSVGFMTFLVQCVDFSGLMKYDAKTPISIAHYINFKNYWNFGAFLWICLIIFIIYIIIQSITIYASTRKFWGIRKIFSESFGIQSKDMSSLNWNQVMAKIIQHHSIPSLNCYTYAVRIMCRENLMITLYDGLKDLKFNKYPLTKLLEWNLIFCFIDPLINEKREIREDVKDNPQEYLTTVKKKIKLASIINAVFMIFILLGLMLYIVLQYGEQFYSNPSLITNRQWSLKATWKLRYYNELPHSFLDRLNKAAKETRIYSEQFPSRLAETISRFCMYVLGSFFIVLLVLTVLNQNLLINLNISHNRSILWYIGALGIIIAFAKSFIHKTILPDPEKAINKMEKHMEIENNWKNDPLSLDTKDEIISLFPWRIVLLLQECFYIILTPYILYFVLREESDRIANYLLDSLTTHHCIPGLISKYSLFNNAEQIGQNQKTERSFKNFNKNYPEWNLNSFMYNINESLHPTAISHKVTESTQTLIDVDEDDDESY
uniref:Autophagy-related protein 9 n=1 Tax=viral metagenome TaxID=1070528 RepID=A0A6C0E983_9ZZZZ